MYFLLEFAEQYVADVVARISEQNQVSHAWYLRFIPTDLQAVKLGNTAGASLQP
jgi:hypothetical protein